MVAGAFNHCLSSSFIACTKRSPNYRMAEPSVSLINPDSIPDDICTNFILGENVSYVKNVISIATVASYIFIKLHENHEATVLLPKWLFTKQERIYKDVYVQKVGLAHPLLLFCEVNWWSASQVIMIKQG